MSKILNRILDNLATRIIFIIYVFFILVTAFFLVYGYYNELSLQKQRQYDKLKAIVSSLAINIDGDAHQEMISSYSDIHKPYTPQENPTYRKIKSILAKAEESNGLNSPIYTLIYNPAKNKFRYGIRSDNFIDLNNEYRQPPESLIKNFETGGVLPPYRSENGIWLSAFYPIKSASGKVVALLEADVEFSGFKASVKRHYLNEAAIVLLVIIGCFVFFILYTRKILREESEKNRLLANQKRIIEFKNKDIMDSIHYALKIQNAMLPEDKHFDENFIDSFVFYKSKDVVAGDFYWLERIGDDIFIAVADCTGHGVPGAILSIICSNALEKVICEMKISNPGKILDEVRKIVINFLTKGEHEINDGMDIALCKINVRQSIMEYSGAYNPVYIVRNNEIIITQPCKQPVGRFIVQKDFKCTMHQLEKGDSLYLFTDGFADQFGGPNKKKFKYKQFRNLILAHSHKGMAAQKNILLDTFNNWRGLEEQIDDVCVVGLQF